MGILTLISAAVAATCWTIVRYCAFLPPKLFWGLPAVVGTLFIPGCLWVLQEAVTGLTFEKKQKFKRFRFDMLDCVSKAPRIVAWAAVAVFPMTVVDLVAFALYAAAGFSIYLFLGALALHAALAFLCWPAGLGHMAMPVSGPGWNFKVVASGTAKNLGPVLFWTALTFAAFLPFLLVAGGAAALSGEQVVDVLGVMETNGQALREGEAAAAESKEEFKAEDVEVATIDWNAFLIPGVALIPLAFLFGFGAVYAARPAGLLARMFRPSLGLITLASEKKYVPKTKRRSELEELDAAEEEGLTWGGVGLAVGLAAVVGAVGGFSWSMVQGEPMTMTIGLGVLFSAGLLGSGAQLGILATAFKEDTKLGLLMFVPGALLWYVATRWHQTKHHFVMSMGGSLLAIVGLIVAIVGGFLAAAPPPA